MLTSVPAETLAPMGIRAYSDPDALLQAAGIEGRDFYLIPNGGTVVPYAEGGK